MVLRSKRLVEKDGAVGEDKTSVRADQGKDPVDGSENKHADYEEYLECIPVEIEEPANDFSVWA